MKPSKSINSLIGNGSNPQQPQTNDTGRHRLNDPSSTMISNPVDGPTSPICRCRVMYLGSSVPHITKDGLQGIQEPLRELYPDAASLAQGNAGIDSWLSVWSNGILVENVDDNGREVKRFFKIEALHYCAAVTYVPQAAAQQAQSSSQSTLSSSANLPKFLPLDSPHARQQGSTNPPVFASILRRTTGIKVLECHAFICKREAAANALVRCCFHAYADTMYAKQFVEIQNKTNNLEAQPRQQVSDGSKTLRNSHASRQPISSRRSKSIAALNDAVDGGERDAWEPSECNQDSTSNREQHDYQIAQVARRKSMNEHYANGNENGSQQMIHNNGSSMLQKQHKSLSKSMHHLNQNPQDVGDYASGAWHQVPQHQPFYNPHAGRVPSYPPQSLIDAANTGGTIKSIKSMAATSIASTLLRSKRHAKAMSTAQLNHDKITSFHQPHLMNGGGHTLAGPLMMPPVPNMFAPNMQRPIINGSQTMKASSSSMLPMMGPPINFEAMTPKEMKKLLKKSAKYGIDPKKFTENRLPLLPLRPPPQPMHPSQIFPMAPQSKSGTMISQSAYSIYGNDMTDMASIQGLSMQRPSPMDDPMDPQAMKPVLVRPNPEFLKSKAGKKWLKQQKEFKKLLPPHLEGLPIVFGPPPIEVLEPAPMQPSSNLPMAPTFIPPPQPGLPMMDSSGYYNPHPFYGPSGRASVASTMMRHSPHSQLHQMHDNLLNGVPVGPEYMQITSQSLYGQNMGPLPMVLAQTGGEYMNGNSSALYGPNDMNDPQTYAMNGHRSHHKRHPSHHMVEQSVISLGDENDNDEDEDEELNNNSSRQNEHSRNGSISHSSRNIRSSGPSSKSFNNDCNGDHTINNNYLDNGPQKHQQEYEQVGGQYSDDQSSYSSGIYRRRHINERAFSHSIRQEHMNSNGQSIETEYNEQPNQDPSRRHHHSQAAAARDYHAENNQRQQQGNIYQSARDPNGVYHRDHNEPQTIPVNELTARLENQLNMKSFARVFT